MAHWQINESFTLPTKDYVVNLDGEPPEGMLCHNIQVLNNASRGHKNWSLLMNLIIIIYSIAIHRVDLLIKNIDCIRIIERRLSLEYSKMNGHVDKHSNRKLSIKCKR